MNKDTFMNNLDNYLKEWEQFKPLVEKIQEQQQELERYKNIVDELEELLENPYNVDCINQNNDFLKRICELKGE